MKSADFRAFFQCAMTYKIPESVLVVIHTKELQVLLIERADKPGFWQSVTGSKDFPEEPLVATAMREVGEETGIHIAQEQADCRAAHGAAIVPFCNLRDWQLSNIYTIYPRWRHRYAPQVTHNTEHVFSLLVPEPIAITLNPREHLQHAWLPYREAADKCFSSSNAEAILQLPRRMT